MHSRFRKFLVPALLLVLAGGAYALWQSQRETGPGPGFAQGNGRIEATEIDIATKLGGRVANIIVNEGDFVRAGQALAHMQIDVLEAQRDEARARLQQAHNTVAGARAQVAARVSNKLAAEAAVLQRESEQKAAQQRLKRSASLAERGATSRQDLDDDSARVHQAQAAVSAAQAQVAAAQAAIDAAQAEVVGAESAVTAAQATLARVEADIQDSQLTAPRDGRVQYRVAQPGEVLGAGGKVLNLVDLSEVYMTFFLPASEAGRVALGAEARIVLDAAPQWVIPATISFVASTAQFTPKTVETHNEREKLMFRVKARVDPALLQQHLTQVKTGLPGVTWVRLDAQQAWPETLQVRLPQ